MSHDDTTAKWSVGQPYNKPPKYANYLIKCLSYRRKTVVLHPPPEIRSFKTIVPSVAVASVDSDDYLLEFEETGCKLVTRATFKPEHSEPKKTPKSKSKKSKS